MRVRASVKTLCRNCKVVRGMIVEDPVDIFEDVVNELWEINSYT